MKKILFLVLSGLLAAGLIAGCSKPKETPVTPTLEPTEVPSEPTATPDEEEVELPQEFAVISELIFSQTEWPSMTELNDEQLASLYYLSTDDLESFSVYVPNMNVHASEIAMFHPKEGKTDVVKESVDKRLNDLNKTWEQYLPAQHELVKNALTYEKDGYYFLVIYDDTASIKDIIDTTFEFSKAK